MQLNFFYPPPLGNVVKRMHKYTNMSFGKYMKILSKKIVSQKFLVFDHDYEAVFQVIEQ